MARKTKTVPKRVWKTRKQDDKIVASHSEGPQVEQIVTDAIQRMAAEDSGAKAQVWFPVVERPGLHIMRTQRGQGVYQFDVVRAVYTDDGLNYVFHIASPDSVHKYNLVDFIDPSFQKVQE